MIRRLWKNTGALIPWWVWALLLAAVVIAAALFITPMDCRAGDAVPVDSFVELARAEDPKPQWCLAIALRDKSGATEIRAGDVVDVIPYPWNQSQFEKADFGKISVYGLTREQACLLKSPLVSVMGTRVHERRYRVADGAIVQWKGKVVDIRATPLFVDKKTGTLVNVSE